MTTGPPAGLTYTFNYLVPDDRTVPHLLPESPDFQEMPLVLATGYMVGLFEWTCIQALRPYLDWPGEQTVGTAINVTHTAPTPPGMTVEIRVRLKDVQGRKLIFEIKANDGVDDISQGEHERFIIRSKSFNDKVKEKRLKHPAPK